MEKLQRKVHLLMAYAIISTGLFAGFLCASFRKPSDKQFDEISVKRINVLGEDGGLRMVISNAKRQHPGRLEGKDLPPRKRPAGIIFFNDEGNECGGLVHYAEKAKGRTDAGMSFTMDQYQNDQVVQLVNEESYAGDQAHSTRGLVINAITPGLSLWKTQEKLQSLQQIPDTALRQQRIGQLVDREFGKRRLLVGKNKKEEYGLFLFDESGKARFQLFVDKDGVPRLQTIDAGGNVKDLLLKPAS